MLDVEPSVHLCVLSSLALEHILMSSSHTYIIIITSVHYGRAVMSFISCQDLLVLFHVQRVCVTYKPKDLSAVFEINVT